MPYVKMTLAESIESVSRPITMEIIDHVKNITKIDKSVPVIFPGDTGKMQQQGSAIDNTNRQTQIASQRYVYIEVDEDDDPQYMASTAIIFPEYNRVFFDKDTKVSMNPLYSTMSVSIHFKYQAPSRTEIKRWRDDIRMLLSALRGIHLHTIKYHYLIPDQYMLLLNAVYNNRQRVLKSNQTFAEYIASNSISNTRMITDVAGLDVRLSIAETQARIVGIYDFDSLPEKPERNEEEAVWTGAFTYKFTYERPVMMAIRYPIIVYNQLLPKEYIAFWNTDYNDSNIDKSYSYSIGSLSNFEAQDQPGKYIDFKSEFRLPDYDDFIPTISPTGSVGVFTALCEVDETDNVTLLNLSDLGDIIIDKDIIDFIVNSELLYVCSLYQSIFYIGLYIDDVLQSTNSLICLPDLTIQATSPLNLKNRHHVRLFLNTDLSLISYQFFQRLQLYPKALIKIIVSLNSALKNNPQLESIAELSKVSISDLSVLFASIPGLRNIVKLNQNSTSTINDLFSIFNSSAYTTYMNNSIRMNTVMISSIVAMNKQ